MDAQFAFFGTGEIAVGVLNELEKARMLPALIVTSPDAPAGRGRAMTESSVAKWAASRTIDVLKPKKLDEAFLSELEARNSKLEASVGVVVDYGALIPQSVIDAFSHGILNMHPSLLPRLRGPSPIRTAILTDEKETGVSIMLLDAELDHGPIVAQKKVAIPNWPPKGRDLDALLSSEGGKLLAKMLPHWVNGDIEAQEQNHDVATYSAEIQKNDAQLDLAGDAHQNLLKIRAYDGWPWAFAYFRRGDKRIRVIVVDAHIENEKLVLDRVKPEGKQEMAYADFARSGVTPE